MATNNRESMKQSIRSTDRGGVVSLAAGILCLALGFGMLIGLTLQANSRTIIALKDLALGLGGVLYIIVPLAALWMGWLLCMSARHYISFRAFGLCLLLLMSLAAFLTLVTSVAGFGSLMDYTRNLNVNYAKVSQPDSFGEYIRQTFNKYDNKLNPLPGGGVLGLLFAFPVWKLLGQIGGLIFLGFLMIALLLILLRLNPVQWIARIENKGERPAGVTGIQSEVQPQPAAAPYDHLAENSQDAYAQGTVYQPTVEPYYVESYQPPVYPALEAYPAAEQSPAQEGFTTANKDYYETFEPAPAVERKPWHERSMQAQFEPSSVPVKPAYKPARAAEKPALQVKSAVTTERPPWEEPPKSVPPHEVQPEPKPAATASASMPDEKPPQSESVIPPPRQVRQTPILLNQPIKDVGIDPVVALTGEKVSVASRLSLAPEVSKLDGTAKPKPQGKQLQIPLDDYERPPTRLLSPPPPNTQVDTSQEDMARADKLIATLNSFNITAQMQQIVHGPAITRFAIRLAEGVNVNRLRNVMDNIAVELLAKSAIRAEIPIPGTPLIGIEVSNDQATTVYLSEVLHSPKMLENKSPTAVALGKDITGAPVICELMDMPHLLIAGATGSGKSVCINSIITSLLYRASPEEVRLILVDPKFVELQPYNDIPHLLLPVVVDPKKAVAALEWVCQEMDERYQKLQKNGVRNIDAYNKKLPPDEESLPKIIVIIDEMSDLMASAGKIIDEHVKRITAKARAAGICLILATQRPSVDVITGIIKANIPSRIAFQVASQVDSRTILDSQGAEKLLGYGDMLYLPRYLSAPKRVQGCFISDKDVGQVTEYVKSRNLADYNVDIIEHIEKGDRRDEPSNGADSAEEGADSFDELLPKAIEMAVEAGQMSISMLQRVLRVGYGRAGRLIDEMARRNIISGNEGTKARKTLITREEYQGLFDDGRYLD